MTTMEIALPVEGSEKLSCALFGHHVDNQRFAENRGGRRKCLCGASILSEGGDETRIRHNVACFIAGHHYVPASERNDHREYVCVTCGHPLLFERGSDPYAIESTFKKRVRYLCNLFGHRVHRVTERNDQTEYACSCGHSFLKSEKEATIVKHPLVCLVAGHFVRFVERRGRYAEYMCRNCGHTFCFEG